MNLFYFGGWGENRIVSHYKSSVFSVPSVVQHHSNRVIKTARP